MNYIVSWYFSDMYDAQRELKKLPDDPSYIQTWYNSLVANGLKGIVFHNGLSDTFISQFPECQFIKVTNNGYQVYDFKYISAQLLNDIEFDNAFLTDISDVKIVKNPFIQPEYNENNIYCGDEIGKIDSWPMLFADARIKAFPKFRSIINNRGQLLNAGIVGGGRDMILKFIYLMNRAIERVKDREETTCVDIPIYNYVFYRYFKPVHGFPVNSVFRGMENRDDVWFIHK